MRVTFGKVSAGSRVASNFQLCFTKNSSCKKNLKDKLRLEVTMKNQGILSINETALRASMARTTRGIGVLDDRPLAISHPEIFENSIVKPKPEDLSEFSTKEGL